jgi:hypothetical protein
MITFVLWKWMQPAPRTVYTSEHVNVMAGMIAHNMKGAKYRILCVTDHAAGLRCESYPLWDDLSDTPNASGRHLPSCYRRLRLYDADTQRQMGIQRGDRIVSIDIDTIVTGDLKPLVALPHRYVGWELRGPKHDRVFNGSLQMFNAGDLQEIWSTFDPVKSPRVANEAGYFGSDQAWLSYNLVGKAGSFGLRYPVVASYPNNTVPMGQLVAQTKLIFFHGRMKPWYPQAIKDTPLIERYWRPEYA